jgi:UDP-N-acetylglucosamine acyltransferase
MKETRRPESAPPKTTIEIDPLASVSPRAKLANGVSIGAWAIVGDDVELGEGCKVLPHAVVKGPSKFGRENIFHSFCAVGVDPQDLKFAGEKTSLIVGDANVFREYVTVSRGTLHGGGVTRIGSHNLFMASAHIGHDSVVGDHCLFVNGGTIAGHVIVEDHATLGCWSPVHQFCRIGRHAYIGALTMISQDVPPFALVVTERETRSFGANKIGLERKGFTPERTRAIEQAYRILTRSKLNTSQAVTRMRETLGDSEDVKQLIAFIESSKRGFIK